MGLASLLSSVVIRRRGDEWAGKRFELCDSSTRDRAMSCYRATFRCHGSKRLPVSEEWRGTATPLFCGRGVATGFQPLATLLVEDRYFSQLNATTVRNSTQHTVRRLTDGSPGCFGPSTQLPGEGDDVRGHSAGSITAGRGHRRNSDATNPTGTRRAGTQPTSTQRHATRENAKIRNATWTRLIPTQHHRT